MPLPHGPAAKGDSAKQRRFDAILKLRPERKQTRLAWINKIRWWSGSVWWNLFVSVHGCDIAGWWTGQSSCKGSCRGRKEGGLWREISLKGTLVWPASSTFLEIQAAQAVFLTESLGRNFNFLSVYLQTFWNVRMSHLGSKNEAAIPLCGICRCCQGWLGDRAFNPTGQGLRRGEAVQVDVILFSKSIGRQSLWQWLQCLVPTIQKREVPEILPQDVEGRNMMHLLWSSIPCQEKVLEMQILATWSTWAFQAS